ncbi:MAG: phospho-N-acetylmuramoyl-pentapeptide-transferase [Lachnospiraceae bacterium]|nr:phospho-N-acetylmuramoyl-pentapeptide-transferase [Lachnospiraceae bacterium]
MAITGLNKIFDPVVFWPMLISFIISFIGMKFGLPVLKKLHLGQYEREEGPEAHKKKAGTPTMGGIIFLITSTVTAVIFLIYFAASKTDYTGFTKIIPVMLVTLGFGVIGFLDDFIKIKMKRNMGLTSLQKMAGEVIVTLAFVIYLVGFSGLGTYTVIPFSGYVWDAPAWFYVICMFIIILGTVNGSNFTDGLDGLLSSVTIVIGAFLIYAGICAGSMTAAYSAIMTGALIAFLWFNSYPAKVFMGDSGSLAIGGFVASASYMLRMPIFIAIIAVIYLVEILSVMIQVAYFKKTGGKRIFKMSPLHHHYELSGWHESKVVSIFTIVTVIACIIAALAM